MTTIDVNGETIAYVRAGSGDPLILIHSLGTASWLWERQIAHWSAAFDTIAIDARGHGASTRRGGFSVRGVASDIAAIAEALGLRPARVVGLSMGGPIAAHLCDLAPDAVERLVLADSFATQGTAGAERAAAIEATIAAVGMSEYARRYAGDTLAPESAAEWHERLAAGIAGMSPEAYVEAARSVFTADVAAILKRVAVPTLVVVGSEDQRTPPRLSEEIAGLVPGATLTRIEGARHLAHLDRPDAFLAAIDPFLHAARRAPVRPPPSKETAMTDDTCEHDTYEKGLEIRRAVVGSAYVDRSLAEADDFTRPLQELVTRYCWGEVWSRPGLERRDRSLLNLGMIAALNRPHELKLHVRGAVNNGLTRDEIREALMQVAIYCGVPAALDSFRVAREVFREMDAEAAAPAR